MSLMQIDKEEHTEFPKELGIEKINVSELNNLIKKNNNTDKIKIDSYITYILLEKTIMLDEKIKAYGNRTAINYLLKDNQTINYSINKLVNIYLKHKKELINTDCFIIIKALWRAAIVNSKDSFLISLFYSYSACNLINTLPKEDNENIFKQIIKYYEKNIQIEQFKDKKEFFLNNQNFNKIKNLNEIIHKVINYNNNSINNESNNNIIKNDDTMDTDINSENVNNRPITNSIKDEEDEEEFIISKNWLENANNFLNNVCNLIAEENEKKFEIIINKFFNELYIKNYWFNNNKYDSINEEVYYCGPINNLFIIDEKDFWFDPIDKKSNVFIRKDINSSDYYFVKKEDYEKIKEIFEIYPQLEIIRKKNEINLNDSKILILSKLLKDNKLDNYIRLRHIQYSNEESFESFKNKINRILSNFIKKEIKNFNINVYYADLNNYQIFTLISVYEYDNKNFELSINELNLKEINNEEDFKNYKNLSKNQKLKLVVEFNENVEKNTFLLNNNIHNFEICHSCNKINSDKEKKFLKCKRLSSCPLRFCCKKCFKKDSAHEKFHRYFNSLLVQKFSMKYLLKLKLDDYLDKDCKHGLTGLNNLGNTCFMNSAIQCLSHCELLTIYFLSGLYKNEINKNKKFGSGGNIVTSYYDLLYKLWEEKKDNIHPLNFREIFVNYVKQFEGFSQQDSHEFLNFMLDNIHEDLNRVEDKKYIELDEKKDNETDIEASKRWWDYNLLRDNSIIVDLFYGQFKNTLSCNICDKQSVIFDNYMCIGLPINENNAIGFFYIINNKTNKLRIRQISFEINELVKDIYEKIDLKKKYLGILVRKNNDYLTYLKEDCDLYKLVCQCLNNIDEPNFKIILYEFEPEEINDKIPIYVLPMMKKNEDKLNDESDIERLNFPKVFYFNENDTVQDLYNEIKLYYYKFFNIENFNKEEIFEKIPNEKIKLSIINNLRVKKELTCDYCKKHDCLYCDFNFNLNDTIKTLKDSQSKPRAFLLNFHIPYDEKLKEIILYPEYYAEKRTFLVNEKKNLYSCFTHLLKCEKLDENNLWYCNKCKEHRPAFKQLEIMKLPRILIIQLKRFTERGQGFFQNRKDNSYIDFPFILNLDNFISNLPENKHYKYELFAINNQIGFSFLGHYTAYCKNDGKWYKFDDEDITLIYNEDLIFSSNAYILFYKFIDEDNNENDK